MKTVAVLIAMAATLATCDAFNCHECSSPKSEACGETFSATSATTVTCDTACFKAVTKVETILGSSTTYSRGCSTTTPNSMSCSKDSGGISGLASGSTEACYCNSELCNSASNLLPSIVQIVMIVAAALFFQKF
ncbi:uncharacterized protein LOC106176639 [Lingula anatina]|uniref:Uncharacterized protein LOC106176639 n=1 Tax=Lingula anatina TaxID=7574 RepID=A0A1S3JW76_LINAN|nr:uncharacterized protein LOC106176639 [Lingula anatina]|eukprot:XP_013414557.1 uncharacterized protein LOC106176639 [Lingula anatina]